MSLTSTGMSDGRSTSVVQTTPGTQLEERLDQLVRGVMRFVLPSPINGPVPDLAVIEAGAFSRGAQSSAAEYLSALRLMVRHRLWRLDIPFAMVAPTTLKLYTTGSGRASKAEMVAALDERHSTDFAAVKVKDGRYDRADAFALAAMGYDRVGQPLPMDHPCPEPRRDSLDAVRWPALLSD